MLEFMAVTFGCVILLCLMFAAIATVVLYLRFIYRLAQRKENTNICPRCRRDMS